VGVVNRTSKALGKALYARFCFVDGEDIKALKDCKPANCQIQLPASSIDALQQSVDLSAPDAEEKVKKWLDPSVIEASARLPEGSGPSSVGVQR
jgi:hypothetical protein